MNARGVHKIIKESLFIVIQIILLNPLLAQSKRGNIGVFGDLSRVAIDFNHEPPVINLLPVVAISNQFTMEGSASISDADGNLLFYTNGWRVYNAEHNIMPNGADLMGFLGDQLTTTQIIIVPIPKDPFRYYIVGAQYQGRKLFYSIVDMRSDYGRGDVVKKDVLLYDKSTEKACVVKHSSGEALWLVTHEFGTNRFKTFLIDEDSIHASRPVISSVGLVHSTQIKVIDGREVTGTNAIGYLKPSHDGRLLACAINGTMNNLELFQFNNTTGEVTNPLLLDDGLPWPGSYGVEFSPDDSKLYLSCLDGGYLYQFNLLAGTWNDIENSVVTISHGERPGASLQLGPDGRIYRVRGNLDSLDVIEAPNELGLLCNYVKNKISLKGVRVWMGLPEFIYNNTVDPEILYDGYCLGVSTKFKLVKIKDFTSITWDFGDALSGSQNFSSELEPVHTYKSPGQYKVKIQVTFPDQSIFNYTQPVSILPVPELDLGMDTIKCVGTSVNLKPLNSIGTSAIAWSTGSTNDNITVNTPGMYWAKVSNDVCTARDTINVIDLAPPTFVLRDTALCSYHVLRVQLNEKYNYLWGDGMTSSARTITAKGKYTVQAQNKCGTLSREMNVSFIPNLMLSLGDDTTMCANQKLHLDATNSVAKYLWHDGSDTPTFDVVESGEYSVQVYNRCESLKDTIQVKYINDAPYFVPNVITPNGDGMNDYFIIDEKLKDASIIICNRWGNSVFKSLPYNNDWSGNSLDSGVYYYSITDKCAGAEIKGPIQVIK